MRSVFCGAGPCACPHRMLFCCVAEFSSFIFARYGLTPEEVAAIALPEPVKPLHASATISNRTGFKAKVRAYGEGVTGATARGAGAPCAARRHGLARGSQSTHE